MKPIKIVVFAFILGGTSIFTQCKKEEVDLLDCAGVTPTYTANVKTILDNNCATAGCHSASSRRAGYDLSSYAASVTSGGNQAFLGSVQHISGYDPMPDGGAKLPEADVKTLSCWVQNGMPQ